MKTTATQPILRAEALGATLPPLLVAAERVAATVAQGVHGRRRVGQGDSFWQFRPYQAGDAPGRIDWRQSAKSARTYVRETEWEAAQTVHLWRDGSASMHWRSGAAMPAKIERAELLLLALASLLQRGGERVRLLGQRTGGSLPAMAAALGGVADSEPPNVSMPAHGRVVLFGDFLHPLEEDPRHRGPPVRNPRARPPAPGARPGGGAAALHRPGAVPRRGGRW